MINIIFSYLSNLSILNKYYTEQFYYDYNSYTYSLYFKTGLICANYRFPYPKKYYNDIYKFDRPVAVISKSYFFNNVI